MKEGIYMIVCMQDVSSTLICISRNYKQSKRPSDHNRHSMGEPQSSTKLEKPVRHAHTLPHPYTEGKYCCLIQKTK